VKSYKLREMTEGDLEFVLQWRNHPAIRNVSGSNLHISRDEQYLWFNCSTDTLKFIFTEEEKPLGVIISDANDYWGFYLDPSIDRHRGLGRLMLSLFLVHAKERNFKEIKAKVNKTNEGSHVLHKSLGFQVRGIYSNGDIEYRKGL